MSDKREEILIKNNCTIENIFNSVEGAVDDVKSAMDEYMKDVCLELMDYMAKHLVICGHWSSPDGFLFKYKGELITKEQLFENFL